MGEGCLGNEACRSVLDQLEFMQGLLMEAKEERVALVNTGCNKTAEKESDRTGGFNFG